MIAEDSLKCKIEVDRNNEDLTKVKVKIHNERRKMKVVQKQGHASDYL